MLQQRLTDWVARAAASTTLDGLGGAKTAFFLSQLKAETSEALIWVRQSNREIEQAAADLRFFAGANAQISRFPGLEADPYRGLSPHPEISERRAITLFEILQRGTDFLVTTPEALLVRLPSPSNFSASCVHLEVGTLYPLGHLVAQLRQAGYVREDPVGSLGEFSRRGGIVDFFSPAHSNPIRVEFFGDEIDSIREFDPSTQRSIRLVVSSEIVPMREMVITDSEVGRFHREAPEYWNEVRFAEALEDKRQFTETGDLFNGFEFLMPLVTSCDGALSEYFEVAGQGCRVVVDEPETSVERTREYLAHLQSSFDDRHEAGELVLPPERLFWQIPELTNWLEQDGTHRIYELFDGGTAAHFDFRTERSYHGRVQDLLADVAQWADAGERVLFVTHTTGMAERVIDIFGQYEVAVHHATDFVDATGHPISAVEGLLTGGFHSPDLGIHILAQENLFDAAPQPVKSRQPTRSKNLVGTFLSDFRDLKSGDHVVHVEHGIGQFRGLKTIGLGAAEREFVELVYKGDSKLYVPVDRLDLLQKFSGAGQGAPQLDRLGGVSWERTKKKIKRSIRVLAEDLLKLYARRQVATGFAYSADDAILKEFEESFEYEETTDQDYAIRDIKRDMESPRPMDRLVCGDVGYGKTEVAMRAAFKAVNDSFQVAVLAPTTVLAFQHFNTFRDRFQGFPVTVEMISRFLSPADQREAAQRASAGAVDIMIGTHRILSKDVKFAKLGLLIIDEEQRFGVAQKERLKKLKTEVDVLSLSATPIPRTLNMSLVGVRDLSIIETPPKDRLAIQTVVVRFSRDIIRSALDVELRRKGQVFFVHNSIETIQSIAQMVRELVPEARVAVAHGRMGEGQLEAIMFDFLQHKYDVLVCTTIIENGLDIPRANTLIVNRADQFGLSQLYQLRGRVGRSTRRAYAYLLIPSQETLTTVARKRLAAIREFSDLGAGFRIAAHDLEIRGAGNLLGSEQHGHINAVGLELYMKLLEQTIAELKGTPIDETPDVTIDLGLDIQVPEHYIGDSSLRLWLYKRVASVSDKKGLENLTGETIDRFGKYPRSVSNLFAYCGLRLHAKPLGVVSLDRKSGQLQAKFHKSTPINVESLLSTVHRDRELSLSPEGVLFKRLKEGRDHDILEAAADLLEQLAVLQ